METKVFTIFHTTDIHGNFNQSKVKKLQDLLKNCDTPKILVDSGDILKGGNILFYPVENTFKYIKLLNYTAICLGNREFNYIRPVFYSRLKKFPFIACNLIDKKLKNQIIQPSVHIVIEWLRITIIGITKPQYKPDHFWEKVTNFRFEYVNNSVKKEIEKYYKITDVFIILSHLGIDDDMLLADYIFNEFSNIRNKIIILGGHDHKEFFDDKKIPIIHSHPFLQKITTLELFFKVNKNNKILETMEISKVELN